MTLLRRSSVRHLWRHRWQTALSVLGVGLGVAVVLAVDLAVSSARRGFTISAETVAGRATHQAVAGPTGLPDSTYRTLRRLPGVAAAAPVVDGDVVAVDGGAVLRVLGVDPFAEAPFRRYSGGGEIGPAASALIGARTGLLSRSTAAALGVEEADWLYVDAAGRRDSLRVAGLLDPVDEASRLGLENILIVDIGTAQALLDRQRLDRVDLILEGVGGAGVEGARGAAVKAEPAAGDPAAAVVDAVQAVLPGGATVQRSGATVGALRDMTRAFDLNLRALSLLALIFGIFLIYNSVTFSVVQRRRLLGTLRALGATRREVFGLVQAEALAMGIAGAVLGVALGIGLGQGLVRLVTRTIQDLYFVVTVRELILTPWTLAKSIGLGVVGTLAAAAPPALEGAFTHPRAALMRSELESGLRRRLPAVSWTGAALMAAGGVVLWASSSVDGSFLGLFGVILGMALLTPLVTVVMMRTLKPVAGRVFGILGRMAAGGVTAGLSRTAPAMAALTIAVATTIGVAVMVGSFRGSLIEWLDRTLSADIYIAPARPGGTGGATGSVNISPAAVGTLAADPAVSEVRRYRRGDVPTADGPVDLMAIGIDSRLRGHFDFLAGDPAEFWPDFVRGRALMASEPFAYRREVEVGDSITLRTARGRVTLPVMAVFRDYGSDQGMLMLSYDGYTELFRDSTVTTMALILEPGADREAVIRRLKEATASQQALSIRSNRAVGEASLVVFDRTFAITQVLRLLALIVAFVGVLSALMALQLERGRELGVLRANGLTPRQVWAMVSSQTGLMGIASGLMAVPMGLILAVLMIEFVNRRSFGWSIDLAVPAGVLVQAVGLALAAALLAGLYPSWRMARTSPAEALRSE
ncbi:MAG: ABC transporter permease [Longimicrobiales bacterium]|nr:ABC transporter permease [Longimicrobiales bacterium]